MDKEIKNIPILSFFTGGGFLDMGFEMAEVEGMPGFEVCWTNEVNQNFADLYAEGYSSWKKDFLGKEISVEISNKNSIDEITSEILTTEAFNGNKPDLFGIIGGPPCQDFSAAGKNVGFEGERGCLTEVFLNLVHEVSPSFFVMENVKNLVNNNKHRENLLETLKQFKEDYYYDFDVFNSIHFGVPQDRKRMFLVGFKKTLFENEELFELGFDLEVPLLDNRFKKALTNYDWPEIDKFQNGVSPPEDIPPELYVADCVLSKEEENKVDNGDEYFNPYSEKFKNIDEGNTKNRSFKRLHRYRYSPTACYGNNEVHLHPFLPRRLSVRETLRIQSVPDKYILSDEGYLTNKFKMIGNGVPVKLAKAVGKTVLNYLKDSHFFT